MSATIPSPNDGVPVPTRPVVYRPVERRPGPFGDLSRYATVTGKHKYGTDPERAKSQDKARKTLKNLDARRAAAPKEKRSPSGPRTAAGYRPSAAVLTDESLREYAAQGLNSAQIARLVGVAPFTVRNRARDIGLALVKGYRGRLADRIDLDEAHRLHQSGLTWKVLAERYGCNREALRKVMRDYLQSRDAA